MNNLQYFVPFIPQKPWSDELQFQKYKYGSKDFLVQR